MSSYGNVIGGKLKLKGKALDVKAGGVKKKKKQKNEYTRDLSALKIEKSLGGSEDAESDPQVTGEAENVGGEAQSVYEDHRTPAEKRYDEQRDKLDVRRLARLANKSHRDRIEDFNQYLANLSEHYDIPKVGPG